MVYGGDWPQWFEALSGDINNPYNEPHLLTRLDFPVAVAGGLAIELFAGEGGISCGLRMCSVSCFVPWGLRRSNRQNVLTRGNHRGLACNTLWHDHFSQRICFEVGCSTNWSCRTLDFSFGRSVCGQCSGVVPCQLLRVSVDGAIIFCDRKSDSLMPVVASACCWFGCHPRCGFCQFLLQSLGCNVLEEYNDFDNLS